MHYERCCQCHAVKQYKNLIKVWGQMFCCTDCMNDWYDLHGTGYPERAECDFDEHRGRKK